MSTHINAKEGEIARTVLLPGDPLRAKYIAENYLTDAVCFNTVRNMLGYTGCYKGKRISVMGSGMGISSSGIYAYELMTAYGVDTILRLGTAGGISEKLKLKDIVIADGASTTSDINRHIFPGTYCPLADFELTRAAYLTARKHAIPVMVGGILSSDLFYNEDRPADAMQQWQRYGVLAGEMESAGLYTLAKKYGARALTIVTVADSICYDGELSAEDREHALDTMIFLGLETAIAAWHEKEGEE